jgi:hypothetical protein
MLSLDQKCRPAKPACPLDGLPDGLPAGLPDGLPDGLPACTSVRAKQLDSHRTDFHKIIQRTIY